MHIYVFGNLNVGKTALSRKLNQRLIDFTHINLDDYRMKFGDNTVLGEKIAQKHFIIDVIKTKNAIIDFTGYGEVALALCEKIKTKKGILVAVEYPITDAKRDINNNKYEKIPYPAQFKNNFSISQTMDLLAEKTNLLTLEKAWENQIWQSYSYHSEQDFETFWHKFPLQHHLWIERLNDYILEEKDIIEAVLYGSTGANKLSKDSDLDLFIVSPHHIQYWHDKLINELKKDFIFTDILENKIILMSAEGILLEITIGKNLNEIAIFYRESIIYKEGFTLLKKDSETLKKTLSFTPKNLSFANDATKLAAKNYALFCSLPKLIRCQDTYKYYFHCMIIQHTAIRLEHLLINHSVYNYLPKQAAKTLPNFPWEVFHINVKEININQYYQVYNYLKKLFINLENGSLIVKNRYFTEKACVYHANI